MGRRAFFYLGYRSDDPRLRGLFSPIRSLKIGVILRGWRYHFCLILFTGPRFWRERWQMYFQVAFVPWSLTNKSGKFLFKCHLKPVIPLASKLGLAWDLALQWCDGPRTEFWMIDGERCHSRSGTNKSFTSRQRSPNTHLLCWETRRPQMHLIIRRTEGN